MKNTVEARAHQLRTREWLATQQPSRVAVRRCRVDADTYAVQWLTQRAPGPLVPKNVDLLTPETQP